MTTYHFAPVPAYGSVGGLLRLGGRASTTLPVTDTTGASVTVVQGGTTKVGYVEADATGIVPEFTTTDVPVVRIATSVGVLDVNSREAISGAASERVAAEAAQAAAETARDDAVAATAGKVDKGALVLNVKDYGAVGDGVADDTAAIVAAAAAANSRRVLTIGGNAYRPGATLFFPAGYTFNLATLSAPILFSCNVEGAGAQLNAPQTYGQAVVLLGHETSAKLLHTAVVTLPDITKPAPSGDFTAGSIGVKVQNLHHSQVKFGRVSWMETAHLYTGLGQGTVYNVFMPGWVDLCKIGYTLKPGTGGWVNQNVWNAGGISQSANTFTGSTNKRPGYRHVILDGSGGNVVQANTWIGASFEGDYSEYQIEFINAADNIFQGSTRFELGTATTAVTADSTTDLITAPSGFGVVDGDPVVFLAITSVPGGLATRVVYWAVSTSGNTFKVSATRGGTAIDITSNGSGLLAIRPPTLKFDNSAGFTKDNIIRDYNSYPGPLAVIRTGAAAPAAKSPIVG